MKISIVTPSYNQGQFIEEAIQSIIAQNYPNFEHIIVDNCSTDNTSSILKKYPHLKVICESDAGQSDALNKGFTIADGDIIGWLNADDYYLPDCFQKVAQFYQDSPDYDLIYGDYRWINEKGEIIQYRKEIDFDLFILKYLHVLYIPTTSTFFRKKIFLEKNFLDINFDYAMDYDFFLRLAKKKYRFGHCSEFLADFRWHTQNKSLSPLNRSNERVKSLISQEIYLQKLPSIIRKDALTFLMLLARGKRVFLKLSKGLYRTQWPSIS